MLMMLALSPRTYILLSQEVLLMLVMLALRPRVHPLATGIASDAHDAGFHAGE